jgi:Zn-dependent protease with chaperone function
MNPWPFVVAAYAVALLFTAAVTLWSLAAMRRAEREADRLGRGREG